MFPRTTGHCHTHFIPTEVVSVSDPEEITESELSTALTYLKSISADLVKGDVVVFNSIAGYRNDGVTIFTGTEIINLFFDLDDYGSLPNFFQVIKDNVPTNYWSKAIHHNYIVWFDIESVRDQCIANINQQSGVICTTFTYNNTIYYIVLDTSEQSVDHLVSFLLGDTLKPFCCYSDSTINFPNAIYIDDMCADY